MARRQCALLSAYVCVLFFFAAGKSGRLFRPVRSLRGWVPRQLQKKFSREKTNVFFVTDKGVKKKKKQKMTLQNKSLQLLDMSIKDFQTLLNSRPDWISNPTVKCQVRF